MGFRCQLLHSASHPPPPPTPLHSPPHPTLSPKLNPSPLQQHAARFPPAIPDRRYRRYLFFWRGGEALLNGEALIIYKGDVGKPRPRIQQQQQQLKLQARLNPNKEQPSKKSSKTGARGGHRRSRWLQLCRSAGSEGLEKPLTRS